MGRWQHLAVQMVVALGCLMLFASFAAAQGPPSNVNKQELLKTTVKSIKYENNIPIHIQIAKRLAATVGSPRRYASNVFEKPELHPTWQREFVATRLKAPTAEKLETRPRNNIRSLDNHMVSRFAELNASLQDASLDIIAANNTVEIIDNHLFASLSTFDVLRSVSGELVPSSSVRTIAELDSNLVVLAIMIDHSFGVLDLKLQSLHESSLRLSEKVPLTETSTIIPEGQVAILGLALTDNLMAVGVYSYRSISDPDQDYFDRRYELCQMVLIYQYQNANWEYLHTVAYEESTCVRYGYEDDIYDRLVYFGYSVAIDENYLVVGAPYAHGYGRRSGQVNVYRCNHGMDCSLVQTLLPTLELLPVGTLEEVTEAPEGTEVPNDGYEWYAAGRQVMPEASEEPTEHPLPDDHADWTEEDWNYYCFVLDHWDSDYDACRCHYNDGYENWEECPIVDSTYAFFGASTAMHNGVIVVGSSRDQTADFRRTGAVYFFRLDTSMNSFTYEAKDFAVYDPRVYAWYGGIYYGNKVAIFGNLVAVATNALPYIMLYEYDGQVWNRKDRFYPGGHVAYDVDLYENRLLASTSSLAALYQWNGTDWEKQILYHRPSGQGGGSSSLKVAMSENKIAVFDRYWTNSFGERQRGIFIFDHDPSDLMWHQRPAPLVTSGLFQSDLYDVAVAGDHVVGLGEDYYDGSLFYWAL